MTAPPSAPIDARRGKKAAVLRAERWFFEKGGQIGFQITKLVNVASQRVFQQAGRKRPGPRQSKVATHSLAR